MQESLQLIYPGKPKFVEEHYPDLTGKVYIVTGGCTGIGKEVTRRLLQKNAKVWIAARSQSKIDEAIAEFREEILGCNVDYFKVDFSDLATIKPGVTKFLDAEAELHGVVHNAGVMVPPSKSKTEQGYELQFGVNCIGPWLLQKFLDEKILRTAQTAPADTVRILWVSSAAQSLAPRNGGINYKDIEDVDNSRMFQWTFYGQSKAGNIYESLLWAKNHENSNVLSLCCHPGVIRSELDRHSSFLEKLVVKFTGYDTSHGAYTELYAMLSPDLKASQDQGLFVIPWGTRGTIRKDIEDAARGEKGEEFGNWLDAQISKFL